MKLTEMVQAATPTRWPTLGEMGKGTIAIAAVYSALSVLGIGITAPWPARADVVQVQEQIQQVQQQLGDAIAAQQAQSCTLYRILRDGYRKDEADAEADLARNPNSVPARKQKADAAEGIAQMNQKLRQPPCV